MKITIAVPVLLGFLSFSALAEDATLACTGTYANDHGATITFSADGSAVMAFGNNTSDCKGIPKGGSAVSLDCNGMAQPGSFSADCGKVTFGGMDYTKK
ncbi:MAG: hypothetical protein OEZ10_01140 [Gammaproteobacteria bacterium]|nr:hypothetical protein [Gammaproteobacteria bacterium]